MFFRGILPAVVTPFDARGELDFGALGDLVGWLIDSGCHGIVAIGTMGEYRSLSPAERTRLIETVGAAIGGRVPLTVGVSADSAQEASRFAGQAKSLGASGLMSLPPVSYHADDHELTEFFSRVADATDLPLLLYNNPEGSKNDLMPETIAALSNIPNVAGVKECSGDARRIAHILEMTSGAFEVVVGGDDWALEGLCAGATGWVSGCANAAPRECVALFDACERGDLTRARAINGALLPLARFDMHPKLVQFYKAALDEIGRYGGASRGPRLPLSEGERALVNDAVRALKSVTVSG
jgi:4-hydroxy-tetrahydrodipicolinate synthase